MRINERTVLGASGELSDLQYILKCDLLPTAQLALTGLSSVAQLTCIDQAVPDVQLHSTVCVSPTPVDKCACACRLLDELVTADFVADDGIQLGPDEIHAYLQRVLYNRRNKCAA